MLGRTDLPNRLRVISGAKDKDCMKCGKCSASCPSYEKMDIRPHQFVSYLQRGDVDAMMNSTTVWACLCCYACIERCPRDVKPAQIIEAARLMLIRRQGDTPYVSADDIPELLDPDTPQQLLVSALRKYTK
ncbi:MAG: 4Fe-4S dicluster domain-containing protein [Defluviitaleaceae bacterium]|nr:4Fe-4S dicluster domain-containing protein [Defluviitaleaceae bacterium]